MEIRKENAVVFLRLCTRFNRKYLSNFVTYPQLGDCFENENSKTLIDALNLLSKKNKIENFRVIETEHNYMDINFDIPYHITIDKFVRIIKRYSSSFIRNNYPELKTKAKMIWDKNRNYSIVSENKAYIGSVIELKNHYKKFNIEKSKLFSHINNYAKYVYGIDINLIKETSNKVYFYFKIPENISINLFITKIKTSSNKYLLNKYYSNYVHLIKRNHIIQIVSIN